MSLLLAATGGVGQSGRVPPEVIDTDSTGASTSITLAFATTPAEDDLLLAFIRTTGGTSITPPSGWAQYGSNSNATTNVYLTVWYKVAGGSETNSYEFTGASTKRAIGYQIRGADPVTPLVEFGKDANLSTDSVSCSDTNFDVSTASLLLAGVVTAASRTVAYSNSFGDAVANNSLVHTARRAYPQSDTGQNTTASWTTATENAAVLIEVAAE